MAERKISSDVEAYLAGIAEPARSMLEKIRHIVWSLAPEAEEVIAYGIPTFKLNGNLVHYANFTNHCSFFPGGTVRNEALKDQLSGYKTSKGTIQFTRDNPLPDDLIRKIVIMRLEENRELAAAKKQKKPAK